MIPRKLILVFCGLSVISYGAEEQAQFDALYCNNHSLPKTDAWRAKIVLDSCRLPYNRMAVCSADGRVIRVLESGLMDSYFDRAKAESVSLASVRQSGIYNLYNEDHVVTMADLLFLRMTNDIAWANIEELSSSAKLAEDLIDMYNFQAAMLSIALGNSEDLVENIAGYVKLLANLLKDFKCIFLVVPK